MGLERHLIIHHLWRKGHLIVHHLRLGLELHWVAHPLSKLLREALLERHLVVHYGGLVEYIGDLPVGINRSEDNEGLDPFFVVDGGVYGVVVPENGFVLAYDRLDVFCELF